MTINTTTQIQPGKSGLVQLAQVPVEVAASQTLKDMQPVILSSGQVAAHTAAGAEDIYGFIIGDHTTAAGETEEAMMIPAKADNIMKGIVSGSFAQANIGSSFEFSESSDVWAINIAGTTNPVAKILGIPNGPVDGEYGDGSEVYFIIDPAASSY